MSSEQKEGKEVSISVGNQVLRLWGFLCCACVYGWGRGEGVGVGITSLFTSELSMRVKLPPFGLEEVVRAH